MMQSRGVVEMFNHAHGLYADTWSAWAELILNVGITLIAGYFYGIIGILLGKIVSVFLIVVFWKPYYLFASGFKLPISVYWKGTIRYYLIFGISFVLVDVLNGLLPFSANSCWLSLIGYACVVIVCYLIVNSLLLFLFALGIKDILLRIKYYQ